MGTINEQLIKSASHGDTEAVKRLLGEGADVHARWNFALRLASENGHVEVVKLLLSAGANIHAQEDAALLVARKNGHTETVKLLSTKQWGN
jgi:ankyrin repeat protein